MIIQADPNNPLCACRCGTPVSPEPLSSMNASRRKGRSERYAHGHTARNRRTSILGLSERFWAKVEVDPESGCWEWTGSKVRKGPGRGYGKFNVAGTPRVAYKVAYEALVAPVLNGLELDHLCRNRGCCNPEHLEPVTHAENMARSSRAMQTHCLRGHEFTEANTYRAKNGTRNCRRCHADYERARNAKKRIQRAAEG